MTRRLIVMIALMLGIISASAQLPFDKYTIKREELPEAAQEMLKVDHHLLKRTDYDVKLTNGTKIEFSSKGRWTSVDCKNKSVPESLVSKAIRNSVAKKYPGEKIVRISRSSLYYTIGLSNGKELKYDLLGIFQGELTREEAAAFEAQALAEADSTSVGD